jgi:SNF2 family DNA or RNA helicase
MNETQRKIYDAHINDAKMKLDEGSNIEILAYLTRLRQICVDPKLFIDEYSLGSGKIDYLKEMLPKYINDGHKILIFSSFVTGLNIVSDLLKELGIEYLMLTGDTKLEQRKLDTDEFNKNDDIKVYLISLKAGGTGLNLVGADTVVHLDPWWNVSAENQATDRAHRIGQTRNVEVIKLVAEESIEERVIELQNIKRRVIDDIISDNDKSITGFTLDDLRFILS